MNAFAIIILIALVVDVLVHLIGNLLNFGAINLDLPSTLQGLYPPDVYRKSQEYLRANMKYSTITICSQLALLLVFWLLLNGFNWLDQVVRSWNFTPLVNGLFYIGILFLVYNLFMLPFSIYRTFVLEARFGFNKTTRHTFVLDWVKWLVLEVVLGGLVMAGVLALFEGTGVLAWLYCWLMVVAVTLILQYIMPTWIMPLFNKFKPLEEGELKEAILNYLSSVKFPIKNIYVVNASRRSTKMNAYFTGFGKNKIIALYDTLIKNLSVQQIVAVLAHEVGHYKKKHVIQGMIMSVIQDCFIFFLISIFINYPELYIAFNMTEQSIYAGLLFFVLLFMPIQLVISILMHALSRKHEYDADRFAVETTEDPHHHIEALKKLNTRNLGNLTPHPFFVIIAYTHPPLLQRIQAMEKVKPKKAT
nr:M48 family metallopeptidase [Candidatus Sigynarchaeota archaeon]